MVDPVIYWEPAVLRAIGLTLLVFASSLLATKSIDRVAGISDGQRTALAFALCATVYGVWRNTPAYQRLAVWTSALVAVLLPLVICYLTFDELVTLDR